VKALFALAIAQVSLMASAAPGPLVLNASPTTSPMPPHKLVPMPARIAKLYSKIAELWNSNRLIYCDGQRAIDETVTVIRKLHGVKAVHYVAASSEIEVITADGAQGAVDVSTLPRRQDHPNCLAD
jgi:hypothetical protein